jgi:cytochrome c oxidase cbb3-type subunit 3
MSSTSTDTKGTTRETPDMGHEYDGIRELDNRLPNWWLAILFGTVVFGYGYWMYYHVLEGPSMMATYQAEEEAAKKKLAAQAATITDEAVVKLSKDEKVITQAKTIFAQTCAACHGNDGEGKIGPNLTDGAWLHGSKPTEIYKTISSGVAAKGMPAWEPVLGAEKVRMLTAYIETLKGKNLPGKGPEGVTGENGGGGGTMVAGAGAGAGAR